MTPEHLGLLEADPGLESLLKALGVSIVGGAPRLAGATSPGEAEIAAVGWATVDGDRAEQEFGQCFEPAARDTLLGASTRRSRGQRPETVLLEPDTEGRLAGALARHGEGPIALYVNVPDPAGEATHVNPGQSVRAGTGPFGHEWLVLGPEPSGPFLILVGELVGAPACLQTDAVPSDP